MQRVASPFADVAGATANAPALRDATADDITAIAELIARSAEMLSRGFYTADERNAAIDHVFGVDRQLIADRTYFVVTSDSTFIGCGGWSKRETLFGGDQVAERSPRLLDPATEAARIRAFFVDPDAARSGVASALLAASEQAARDQGFHKFELLATLPGVPFYTARGFAITDRITIDLGGVSVPFVAMRK